MFYHKTVENGYIVSVESCSNDLTGLVDTPITKEEYDTIMECFNNIPAYSDTYGYRLKADTLEWESFELPVEEYDPEEDIEIPEW